MDHTLGEGIHRHLMKHAGLGIGYWSPDGKLLLFNEQGAANMGGKPEQFVGKTMVDLFGEEAGRVYLERIHRCVEGMEVFECEDQIDLPPGTRTYLSKYSPVPGEDGQALGVLIISQDITLLKETEQKLLHSQRLEAVGRLAGGVAHDFNNLLTSILGNLGLAATELPEGDELRELIDEARDAATKAATLTRQLLAFSRKQVLQVKVFDLNQLLESTSRLMRRIIGESIRFEFQAAETDLRLKADAAQLEQVFVNLTVNAKDAMPRGGTLVIRSGRRALSPEEAQKLELPAGTYLSVAVSDDGQGMDEETLARIFEPFFTTKGLADGAGLGLATAYGIVRQHGGALLVTSTPGQGSRFEVLLPGTQEPQSPRDGTEAPPPKPRGTEHILLVEDAAAVQRFTLRALQQLGYRVQVADTAEQALAWLRSSGQRPDLLLTDLVMPGMNGKELARQARTLLPELKVLFMSGYPEDNLRQQGLETIEAIFLAKPFNPDALAHKLRSLLDAGEALPVD